MPTVLDQWLDKRDKAPERESATALDQWLDKRQVQEPAPPRPPAQPPTTQPAPVFPTSHPTVRNRDGTTSNVMMGSFEFEGKHLVLPTMVGGEQLSNDAAVRVARGHGLDKYPSFGTSEEAEAWIRQNHAKVRAPSAKGETLPSVEEFFARLKEPVITAGQRRREARQRRLETDARLRKEMPPVEVDEFDAAATKEAQRYEQFKALELSNHLQAMDSLLRPTGWPLPTQVPALDRGEFTPEEVQRFTQYRQAERDAARQPMGPHERLEAMRKYGFALKTARNAGAWRKALRDTASFVLEMMKLNLRLFSAPGQRTVADQAPFVRQLDRQVGYLQEKGDRAYLKFLEDNGVPSYVLGYAIERLGEGGAAQVFRAGEDISPFTVQSLKREGPSGLIDLGLTIATIGGLNRALRVMAKSRIVHRLLVSSGVGAAGYVRAKAHNPDIPERAAWKAGAQGALVYFGIATLFDGIMAVADRGGIMQTAKEFRLNPKNPTDKGIARAIYRLRSKGQLVDAGAVEDMAKGRAAAGWDVFGLPPGSSLKVLLSRYREIFRQRGYGRVVRIVNGGESVSKHYGTGPDAMHRYKLALTGWKRLEIAKRILLDPGNKEAMADMFRFARVNEAYEAGVARTEELLKKHGAAPTKARPSVTTPKPGEIVPTKPTARAQAVEALSAHQAALRASALRPPAPPRAVPVVAPAKVPPTEAPAAPVEPVAAEVAPEAIQPPEVLPEAPPAEAPAAPAEVPPEVPVPPAKQPWEMTKEEYAASPTEIDVRRQGRKGAKPETVTVRKSLEGLNPHDPGYVDYAIDRNHRAAVQQALSEGKPVPPEVLADYPDLAPTEAPPIEAPAEAPAIEAAPEVATRVTGLRPGEGPKTVKGRIRQAIRPEPTMAVTERKLLKWVEQAKERAAAHAYKAGSADIAKAHAELTRFAQDLLPLSQQQRYLSRIAKSRTGGQIVAVARSIATKAQQNRIDQVSKEEVIVTPRQLLRWSMQQAQKSSSKAYMAGARGVIADHRALIEYANERLPKEYQGRAMPIIGKARTRAEITAATAAIDMLADTVKMTKAVARFRKVRASLDLKHMRPEARVRAKALLDTITLSAPSDSVLGKALKLHDAIKSSYLEGEPKIAEPLESDLALEVPDRVIQHMQNTLARAERVPLGMLTPDAVDAVSDALAHIKFLAENKNRMLANRRHRDAGKAVTAAADEVTRFTGKPRRLLFRRAPGLVYRFAFNLQSHETVVDYLMGLDGVGADVLVNTIREGINESARVHLEAADVLRGVLTKRGIDFRAWSDTKLRLGQRLWRKFGGQPTDTRAELLDTPLPTARWADGTKVGLLKLTRAERVSLLCHLDDASTRREILRNRAEGIALARQPDEAIKLTFADVKAIREGATADEQAVVAALKGYVNGSLREQLNDMWVSQKGYEIATREDHWSRRRTDETSDPEPDKFLSQWADRFLDQQRGFKPRTGSLKPVLIGDAFAEFQNHTSAAAAYIGKHGPSVDAIRLIRNSAFRRAVRRRVLYGDYWLEKMEDLVREYRGLGYTRKDAMGRIVSRLTRGGHVAYIGAKPWIWLYQPVSYALISSEVKAKYVVGVWNWKLPGNKQAEQEIAKHAPEIRMRFEAGGHAILTADVAGESLEQFATGKLSARLAERAGMWGVRKFDRAAIVNIWQVVKAEGVGEHNLKGEALLEYAAQRLLMLVARTQPSSDLLSVSGLARESFRHPLVKPLLMFTNQRSKITNMYIRTWNGWRRGTKTPADVAKMAALLTLNTAIVYTLGHYGRKLFSTRDDDKSFGRHMAEFLAMVASNVQIIGSIVGRAIKSLHGTIFDEQHFKETGDTVVEAVTKEALGVLDHTSKSVGAAITGEVVERGPERGKAKWATEAKRAARDAVLPLSVLLKVPGPGVQKIAEKAYSFISPAEESGRSKAYYHREYRKRAAEFILDDKRDKAEETIKSYHRRYSDGPKLMMRQVEAAARQMEIKGKTR